MAKKRKKAKEEKVVFEPPEFDEVEFMEREIVAAKVAVAVAVFSLPMAVASYALTVASLPIIAFFLGLGGMVLLKPYFQRLGISTDGWERRAWAGHGAVYFFTWLAVWVLLVNAPFSDLTPPSINRVEVVHAGASYSVNAGDLVEVAANGTNVTPLVVQARVGDNAALRSVTISVGGDSPVAMSPTDGGLLYAYSMSGYVLNVTYGVRLMAEDSGGRVTEFAFTLRAG